MQCALPQGALQDEYMGYVKAPAPTLQPLMQSRALLGLHLHLM